MTDHVALTNEQIEFLKTWYTADQFQGLVEAFGEFFEEARTTLAKTAPMMSELSSSHTREVALQARRDRNTGPSRPSAQNARRPRRHI